MNDDDDDDDEPATAADYQLKVQQSFNFTHAERLGRIQRAVLPKMKDCKPATLKAILSYLNTFPPGKCYPGIPRIGEATQFSVRQVKRAIKALKQIGVLCGDRHLCSEGYTCNHYALVWSELELLGRPRPTRPAQSELATRRPATRPVTETSPSFSDADHTSAGAPFDGAIAVDQSAIAVDQSAIAVDQSATLSCNRVFTNQEQEILLPPPLVRSAYWGTAVVELLRVGISSYRKVIECAQARQLSEPQFLDQLQLGLTIVDLPANAGKFRDRLGTLAWYLREGTWPAANVVQPGEQAQQDQRAAAQREQQRKEARLYHLVTSSRRRRVPDEEIRRRVRMELGEEFCRGKGW